MESIDFCYNWNNKLAGKYFTTLRLKNIFKYKVGEIYQITFKKQFLFFAEIVEIRDIKIDQINEYIAGIDTGYCAYECKNMIRTMYKNMVKDWSIQILSFILFKKSKPKMKTQPQKDALLCHA